MSQFPRPGLYAFLEFCREQFERLVLYTAVRDAVGEAIVRTLVAENTVPEWFLDVPFVSWDGHLKDLGNIPDARPCDCVLIDDNRDYVADDQVAQWIPIVKYESPYPDTDRELGRVQQVIVERFRRADVATAARKHFDYNDDGPWLEMDFPNQLVYRLLVETAARRGSSRVLPQVMSAETAHCR